MDHILLQSKEFQSGEVRNTPNDTPNSSPCVELTPACGKTTPSSSAWQFSKWIPARTGQDILRRVGSSICAEARRNFSALVGGGRGNRAAIGLGRCTLVANLL